MDDYPSWCYYPTPSRPPGWVEDFIAAIGSHRDEIDSMAVDGLNSDKVLAVVRSDLEKLGFEIERGKAKDQKIRRPVLFGDQGVERVAYEIDGMHDELGILVEIEAGRGVMGNAIYRDLVRTSLVVDARYLALGVMQEYRYKSGGRQARSADYLSTKSLLDAVYASGRLKLPFEGVLLFGY